MPGRAPLAPERIHQLTLSREQMGYSFSSAVQHHWKSATFTTWAEAVEELRGGIVVNVNCTARGRRTARAHRIHLHPDGSVELLDHPGPVDEAAERMMAGLGASMATCTAVALCFPTRTRVTSVGLNAGSRQPLDGRVRMLWAAVTWAQDLSTDWSKDLVSTTLHQGVGRTEAAQWMQAGWTPKQAQRFWKQWASFAVAEQWRAAGRTDAAAAVSAGLGQVPDDDQRWLEAGFTVSRAARWRKLSDLPPSEAIVWDRYNAAPSEVGNIKNLPRRYPGLTMETIHDWCAAGVPARSTALQAWWSVTGGDKDLSAKWAPTGIAPSYAYTYEDWNAAHPEAVLTPAVVGAYKRVGFAVAEPALVAAAHAGGVGPRAIRQVLDDPARLPESMVAAVHADAVRDPYNRTLTRSQVRSRMAWWMPSDQFGAATRLVEALAA